MKKEQTKGFAYWSLAGAISVVVMMLLSCNAGLVCAELNYAPPEAIYGYVRDVNGNPISGASVVDLTGGESTTSASNGRYAFGVSAGGTHMVKATKSGFADQTIGVFVSTRTGIGTGDFSLVPTHNNLAEFSKSSYLNDQNLVITFTHANDGGTLSIHLYSPDGSTATTYANLPVGMGEKTFPLMGQQAGIWKMVATSSIYGSWTRTANVGFFVIDYGTLVDPFDNLLMGMATKSSLGSDVSGVTTSVGAEIYSYGTDGPNTKVNIRLATQYVDNNPQPVDTIISVSPIVEKVIWDPDGSGGQAAFGSQYSITNSAIRFQNGLARDAASDVLKYPFGYDYLGEVGSFAIGAVTAAVAPIPGLIIDATYSAAMGAVKAWMTNDFVADFNGDEGASAYWERGTHSHHVKATTYNMVDLYLGPYDMNYAFKIYSVVRGFSNGISYEIVTNPIYICVTA
jgi:hypothetical protein